MWEEVGEGLKKVSVLFTEIEGKKGCIEHFTKVYKLEILAMKNVRDGNFKKVYGKIDRQNRGNI